MEGGGLVSCGTKWEGIVSEHIPGIIYAQWVK